MSLNGISTSTNVGGAVATKLQRRNAKLALATTKRSTPTTNGYRSLHTISGTHTAYVSTSTTSTVSGTASPSIGHPWV